MEKLKYLTIKNIYISEDGLEKIIEIPAIQERLIVFSLDNSRFLSEFIPDVSKMNSLKGLVLPILTSTKDIYDDINIKKFPSSMKIVSFSNGGRLDWLTEENYRLVEISNFILQPIEPLPSNTYLFDNIKWLSYLASHRILISDEKFPEFYLTLKEKLNLGKINLINVKNIKCEFEMNEEQFQYMVNFVALFEKLVSLDLRVNFTKKDASFETSIKPAEKVRKSIQKLGVSAHIGLLKWAFSNFLQIKELRIYFSQESDKNNFKLEPQFIIQHDWLRNLQKILINEIDFSIPTICDLFERLVSLKSFHSVEIGKFRTNSEDIKSPSIESFLSIQTLHIPNQKGTLFDEFLIHFVSKMSNFAEIGVDFMESEQLEKILLTNLNLRKVISIENILDMKSLSEITNLMKSNGNIMFFDFKFQDQSRKLIRFLEIHHKNQSELKINLREDYEKFKI